MQWSNPFNRFGLLLLLAMTISIGSSGLIGLAQGASAIGKTPVSPVAKDRSAYRQQLEADLKAKQALLTVEEKLLDQQLAALGDLRQRLQDAVDKPVDPQEAQQAAAALDPSAPPELPETVKLARFYDTAIYHTQVASNAVRSTQHDIATLKDYLAKLGH